MTLKRKQLKCCFFRQCYDSYDAMPSKLLRNKKNKFKNTSLNKLHKLSPNDKRFWNVLNRMKQKTIINNPPIPHSKIFQHFKSLLDNKKDRPDLEICLEKGPLDDEISHEELTAGIKSMKTTFYCKIMFFSKIRRNTIFEKSRNINQKVGNPTGPFTTVRGSGTASPQKN